MCLNPINIINRSKFLSTEYRQPYFMQVRCGKCVECQRQNSLEWHYRSYEHMKSSFSQGSYCLFDTLTYSDKHLPHLSDFMQLPSKDVDFPCFSFVDIRLFNVRLRRALSRAGYGSQCYTYFLASEYGTSPLGTHRPHYHVLFFVRGDIPFIEMSRLISQCWQLGRTDGVPYKSESYVRLHNLIKGDLEHSLRVTRYVSKYVMKSCAFQKEINRRVNLVVEAYCRDRNLGDDWLESYDGRKYCSDLLRQVNQFHRQSKGFGADVKIEFAQDLVTIPDFTRSVVRIPTPMYYRRKMYQEQIEIDGQRFWSYTEKGMQYLKQREQVTIALMEKRLHELVSNYLPSDSYVPNLKDIAQYLITERGFFVRSDEQLSLSEKLTTPLLFNYITHNDEEQFGEKFVSKNYYGVKESYLPRDNDDCWKIEDMREMCYFNEDYERFLSRLASSCAASNIQKTQRVEHQQALIDEYKALALL